MISIHNPTVTNLEVEYVTDAVKNGWGDKCYDYINRFEKAFAAYIETGYALATSSGSGAIHLSLAAMGVKPGDEVILGEIDWVSSAAAISHLGAKPVFVDVLEDSWCIDPSKIEAAITPKTKVIIAVHIYGNLAEIDKIMAIAKKHNLLLLEDAAESLGSVYKGKKAGSYGDIAIFSFHGTKTITTGEGGMIVTNNSKHIERVRILNSHGRDPKNNNDPEVNRTFWMAELGYKFKMSNIEAALGCAQLERLEEILAKKREIFNWYAMFFADITGIHLNPEPADTVNSYWMPTLVFDKSLDVDSHHLIQYLKNIGIEARPFFFPLSSLPMFETVSRNKIAHGLYKRAVNLPSNFSLTKAEVKTVCEGIIQYLKAKPATIKKIVLANQ